VIEGEVVLTIGGTPVGKGSLRCIGSRGSRQHVLIEDNPRTQEWRDEIARAAHAAEFEVAGAGQAIGVEITSTLPRPAGHYGTGRNAQRVRPSAPKFPVAHGTGDADKLARLVLDALQDADVLADDAQVVEVLSRKSYPDHSWPFPDVLDAPGVRIRIYGIDEDSPDWRPGPDPFLRPDPDDPGT
jgi:Holliday junction resolvase RusA-like endonuclease